MFQESVRFRKAPALQTKHSLRMPLPFSATVPTWSSAGKSLLLPGFSPEPRASKALDPKKRALAAKSCKGSSQTVEAAVFA